MTVLPIHIAAGVLALVFGYAALAAAKGGTLHRRSGRLFVAAMVALSLTGAWIALVAGSPVSVIAGLLTCYFVTTALLTVRRRQPPRWVTVAAMLVAVTVALAGFATGFGILGRRPEAIPMFIFGGVGLLAAAGDIRMMRAGGIQGPRRIARHLWRMCFAMWVAAASFFWGPARPGPRHHLLPGAAANPGAGADRGHGVLAVAHPREEDPAGSRRHRGARRGRPRTLLT